ncbi:MAG: hypothetical protein WD489_11055, partial [Rhodovibrionaceae bacterium]
LRIEGADGDRPILRKFIPLGNLTDQGTIRLLQRLSCKGLDYEDIIAGSLPRNARGYHPVFEPQNSQGGRRQAVTVGHGRHYTASVLRADELPSDWEVAVVEDD